MTEYSIAGKQIKFNTAEDIAPYVEEIKNVVGLTKLDFSGNTIGIDASQVLAEAIEFHKDTLENVNFSDLYTGRLNTEIPQSLLYLLPALLKCKKLTHINLSDNAFGLQTIDPIEDYLGKATTIEHLILSNNGMGPFAGARIGEALFKLSKAKIEAGTPSLKTFVCGRNRLENGSINHLAVALRNHELLAEVRLYQNGIRPAGISKLIEFGLTHNKHLQVIDLQDNTITTRGATELANAVNNWEKLVEINLNDSLLKSKGSKKFVDALANGPVRKDLEVLKLQYNELEQDSLETLIDVVKNKLPNLKVLELNGNRFEEDSKFVEQINDIFEARGFGEIDELDELEEIDSDEEDDSEDEEEGEADKLEEDLDLDELEKELAGKLVISGSKDTSVDEITESLQQSHIKN
jgi:Ran GTPase-activating protein 1